MGQERSGEGKAECRLLGTAVRFVWPDDGTLSDARGEIIHVSWDGDGTPGLLVRWQPGAQPRETFVPDPSWLAGEDGQPLSVPPRTVRLVVAGGLL